MKTHDISIPYGTIYEVDRKNNNVEVNKKLFSVLTCVVVNNSTSVGWSNAKKIQKKLLQEDTSVYKFLAS